MRTGWRTPAVVLACGGIILMLALGTRQGFGLFLRPMSVDLGWGREVFSLAAQRSTPPARTLWSGSRRSRSR